MGRLYELIKDKYESLVTFQNMQENEYENVMNYNNLYNVMINEQFVNYFIDQINNNKRTIFGSREGYSLFIKNNSEVFPKDTYTIPTIKFGDYGMLNAKDYDFPKILDLIEQKLGEKKVDELINNYLEFTPKMQTPPTNPFKDIIEEIKTEIADYGFKEKELEEYKQALDFANSEIVEKHDEGEIDRLIDSVNMSRHKIAISKLPEYCEKHNLDLDILKSYKDQSRALVFSVNKTENQDFLASNLKSKTNYSKNFKDKIIKLDELVKENGLLKVPQGGESDYKEYGFIDYFNKINELKNLVANHSKLNDINDRIENIKNINRVSKEAGDVINKYNKVIDYIKEEFDLDKVALPANVYSGRVHAFDPENPEDFIPNLPSRWDNENAAYGSILNGYCQLKNLCDKTGLTVKQFLDDPVKNFLKSSQKLFAAEDNKYLLPVEGNSLGKRMARVLVMDSNAYVKNLMDVGGMERGLEFITMTSNLDENAIDNMITVQTGIDLFQTCNHSSNILFNENDYDSIKNLFALGNETDNLFTVSNKYFDENMKRGTFAKTYDEKIASIKNVSPLNESRRVLDTLKNYFIERKYIYENAKTLFNDNRANAAEPFNPSKLFVSAKLYFDDYLYKNNINILSLGKKEREEILEFCNDPVGAFAKKYEKEANSLFRTNKNKPIESFASLKQDFKKDFDKLYKDNGNKFLNKFNELNNKEDKLNRGKSIQTILNDNKRSFIRRFFTSSSKEYKALKASIEAESNPNSPTFGDMKGSKYYAMKYLEHKLPEGVDINTLNSNERRRVEFAQTIVKTCEAIEKTSAEYSKNFIAKDNFEFQNKLQKDLDMEMNNDNLIIDNDELNNEINLENN